MWIQTRASAKACTRVQSSTNSQEELIPTEDLSVCSVQRSSLFLSFFFSFSFFSFSKSPHDICSPSPQNCQMLCRFSEQWFQPIICFVTWDYDVTSALISSQHLGDPVFKWVHWPHFLALLSKLACLFCLLAFVNTWHTRLFSLWCHEFDQAKHEKGLCELKTRFDSEASLCHSWFNSAVFPLTFLVQFPRSNLLAHHPQPGITCHPSQGSHPNKCFLFLSLSILKICCSCSTKCFLFFCLAALNKWSTAAETLQHDVSYFWNNIPPMMTAVTDNLSNLFLKEKCGTVIWHQRFCCWTCFCLECHHQWEQDSSSASAFVGLLCSDIGISMCGSALQQCQHQHWCVQVCFACKDAISKQSDHEHQLPNDLNTWQCCIKKHMTNK